MTCYAAVRFVRESAGAPSVPHFDLPTEYDRYDRGVYSAASPGEYYTFFQGPEGVAEVTVEWDHDLRAVVCGDRRLSVDREGDSVSVAVPVVEDTPRDCRNTLNVYSHVGDEDLPVRVEHNDPRRRAGRYAEASWVDAQAAAALNFVFGAREALRDWGLPGTVRDEDAGTLRLMGFESNDPPHGDFPPHWHLNFEYPDHYEGSQIPHLYLDGRGRTVRNGLTVLGSRERSRAHGPRDPALLRDVDGEPRVALDVRPDGGVDIGPAPGEWTYSLVAGDGGFPAEVVVERGGRPWRTVAVEDDVEAGRLAVTTAGPEGGDRCVETYEYDPLTGTLQSG